MEANLIDSRRIRNIFIFRKLITAFHVFKTSGFQGIINNFQKKFYYVIQIFRLKKIANATFLHLSPTGLAIERAKTLAEGVFYIIANAVEGDIAEFGTMHANTAVALAASLSNLGERMHGSELAHGFTGERKLWLFDSFEGFPEASSDIDKMSPHVKSGLWGRGKSYGYPPEVLAKLITNYLKPEQVCIRKGWYKDTVQAIPRKIKYALIHIDCDLYESTMDVLDNLFRQQNISKGAIICFDDWYCNASNPEMGEQKAWRDLVLKYNINFSDKGSYGTACHSFIINSYAN